MLTAIENGTHLSCDLHKIGANQYMKLPVASFFVQKSMVLGGWMGVWVDEWMGGWVDGWVGWWMGGRAGLRISYNQKYIFYEKKS